MLLLLLSSSFFFFPRVEQNNRASQPYLSLSLSLSLSLNSRRTPTTKAWDDESGAREQLAAAASLRGIPTLLLVRGRDGKILQSDGKTRVLRDPNLEGWPWAGIKPATNLLPLWFQWVLLGVFYLAMKHLTKVFRGVMGW